MDQRNGNSYLSVENALKTILDQIKVQKETETIKIADALNRITAETITAKRDIPAFDNSAMDGYLFLSSDLSGGTRKFPVSGEIRPEHETPDPLEEKTSKRIMTGAPIPGGDYTVVPVEQVREMKDEVEVMEVPKRNPVRKQGEGYQKDMVVLNKGVQIRPYEMGLLIESGNRKCQALKPIRIAVQVTGSEVDEDMDSNGPVLESLIRGWPGVDVERWPVLDDEPEKVITRMKELKESSDLVLTTGGISAGRHDYILRSMKKLGANVLVRKVKQKPGKPFTVTQLDGVLFLHLPGNPVSAVFSAEYYGKRAVKHMLDRKSVV